MCGHLFKSFRERSEDDPSQDIDSRLGGTGDLRPSSIRFSPAGWKASDDVVDRTQPTGFDGHAILCDEIIRLLRRSVFEGAELDIHGGMITLVFSNNSAIVLEARLLVDSIPYLPSPPSMYRRLASFVKDPNEGQGKQLEVFYGEPLLACSVLQPAYESAAFLMRFPSGDLRFTHPHNTLLVHFDQGVCGGYPQAGV